MNSKEQITELLENCRGSYLSGEEIATRLGLSRSAVWKAVKALREEGYPITATTNRGYMLDSEYDVLSASGIAECLPAELRWLRIETYDSLTSTNSAAKARAEDGESQGLVICAAEQSAGRGRLGRSFFSPGRTGLYMSILLRPAFSSSLSPMITTAAAVAVARAIEEITGESAGIKWVNDIFVGGLKVCGILTEASFSVETGGLEYAVLGIGVNVYEPDRGFPKELLGIAGALLSSPAADTRNRLCAAIIRNFFGFYDALEKREFLAEYRSRSIVIGKKVALLTLSGEEKDHALAVGIDGDCNLIVRFDDGSERAVSSGEIRVKL